MNNAHYTPTRGIVFMILLIITCFGIRFSGLLNGKQAATICFCGFIFVWGWSLGFDEKGKDELHSKR